MTELKASELPQDTQTSSSTRDSSVEEGYSYSAPRVNADNSNGVIQNKKFDIYRRRATKWGKCLMYIGFFLMIVNTLGIFGNFARLYQIFFTD